jgi:DNA-binding NarL/FixJ family response regulator
MSTGVVRVAIVDPMPIFRAGLECILKSEPDFAVVGSCARGSEVIELAAASAVDLVFLELNGVGNGLAIAQELVRMSERRIRVMFLTMSDRHEDVTAALQAGASGYMLKGIAPQVLLQTVRMVNAGETYIMPELAARLLMGGAQRPRPGNRMAPDPNVLDSLTGREREILKELSLGQTNKEIARKLSITEKTVKHYMGRVLQKLCVRNRTEAVVMSQQIVRAKEQGATGAWAA